MKKIVVIGGTGLLGTPVVNELAKKWNFNIVVPSRIKQGIDPTRSNVEFVKSDITNESHVRALLSDADGVHISLSGDAEFKASMLVKVAKQCRVKLITYISGITVAAENVANESIANKFKLENEISSSGLSYVIFKPTWFIESIPLFVNSGRASYFGKQLTPIPFVSATDYAQMVTQAYLGELRTNISYAVAGPESLTFNSALTRYVSVKHPQIKQVSSTPFVIGKLIAFLSGNKKLKSTVDFMKYFETAKTPEYPAARILIGETKLNDWLRA